METKNKSTQVFEKLKEPHAKVRRAACGSQTAVCVWPPLFYSSGSQSMGHDPNRGHGVSKNGSRRRDQTWIVYF